MVHAGLYRGLGGGAGGPAMMASLFLFELKMLLRSRLNLALGLMLFAALCWGAYNGQQQVREQRAALERIGRHIDAKLKADQADVARHGRPAANRLPYWQDPSDVAGYMRYGLHAFAVKEPWPLAALAVGQARLLPYYLRVELDFVAPPGAAFDFVNPRLLSLGEFDMAFVLVYLLPLVLIAAGAARLASERDSGALALMAAQAPSLGRVALLKALSMAALWLPFTLIAAALAMLLAGLPFPGGEHGAALALAAACLAGYALSWVLLVTLVASCVGVVSSYLVLAAAWIVMAFALPALAALAVGQERGAPSALVVLDELRRVNTLTPQQRDQVFLDFLARHPGYRDAAQRLDRVPYATKQIAVQLAAERDTSARSAALEERQATAAVRAELVQWLSPVMVFDGALQSVAGTDARRHAGFLRAAKDYTDQLRGFFWPRALREAARPNDACVGCAARLNFTEHALVPRFKGSPGLAGQGDVPLKCLYMWTIALMLGLIVRHGAKP